MVKRVYLLILGLLLSSTLIASGLTTPYSTTHLKSSHTRISPGDVFYLSFSITPKDGWHTYWKNPGDSGLKATFDWTLPEGFEVQDTLWPAPSQFSLGPLVNFGYDGTVSLVTPIKVSQEVALDDTFEVSVKADWLVCEDTCIPETGEYKLSLSTALYAVPSTDWPQISNSIKTNPGPYSKSYGFKQVKDTLEIYLEAPLKGLESLYFYPDKQRLILPSSKQILIFNNSGLVLRISLKKDISKLSGVLEFTYKDGSKESVMLSGKVQSTAWLVFAIMFIFSFFGGLLLNIMPCVLPVLSLKLLQLTAHARERSYLIKQHALSYTGGVMVSMWVLAFLIFVLQSSGSAVGWGFHLQSPVVVLSLLYLMFYIALYLFGLAPLPLFFHTLSGKAAQISSPKKGSFLGSFLTGALTVIVATPCTAPFMAPSIGFALTQPLVVTLLIFTSLGLGLASPFLIIAFFPRLIAWLPKPGGWMIKVQYFLAIPMMATVIWLAWVLSIQIGIMLLLWAALGCLIITLFSWYTTIERNYSWRTWSLLIVCLAMTGYLILEPVVSPRTQSFSPQNIQNSLENGQAVLVDVTASWCITCQANKLLVLESNEVKSAFMKNNVRVIVADWTNKNEEITRYLESFGRSGVPLYVYYPLNGKPKILPQVLTKDIILSLLEK